MANGPDIVRKLQQVQELPKGVHWFCPRQTADDLQLYFPEDIESAQDGNKDGTHEAKIAEAKSRKSLVFDAVQVFAFDGPDAAPHQQWLQETLAEQLQTCDICIREFHRGRRDLKQKLEDSYDEEDVRAFLDKFDRINKARIHNGLDKAMEQLAALPPEKRRKKNLDLPGLFAIFEVLNCGPVYNQDDFLKERFDPPFFTLQSKKPLTMSNYTPAMAHFLFGESKQRLQWARTAWSFLTRNLSAAEFEWNVREELFNAMLRVQLVHLDIDFVPQFWAGARLIIEKLDQHLITDSLRPMEADICKLALEHLQIDKDSFKDLLASVKHILTVSPSDFWEAMGSIPPGTWVDQFFSSPALKRGLQVTDGDESSTILDELFTWIIPFLKSIKPVNQPTTCRAIVNQLLGTLQDSAYPQAVKSYCFNLGVILLAITLSNMNGRSFDVSNATISEAFEALAKFIEPITASAKKSSEISAECAEVLQHAIALDCKVLVSGMRASATDPNAKSVKHEIHSKIWKHAVLGLDLDNSTLARSLIVAVRDTVGIEKAVTKPPGSLSESEQSFNAALDSVNANIADFLDRITDFEKKFVCSIFENSDALVAATMLLFSSSSEVRSSAVEVLKNLTGQTTRRETISRFIEDHKPKALDGFSLSYHQVSSRKTFAPCATILRITGDVLDTLCNSQDGLLRRHALSQDDARAIEIFWQTLWHVLSMIFKTTEGWSNAGHDKKMLMDFCKDTMESAEKIFDQFGVFVGSLGQVTATGTESKQKDSIGKRLIEPPKNAMKAIVAWLKLRDDFLVSKSLALVCKLLDRLTEYEAVLSEETLDFLARVLSGEVRTMLTQQQKASLQRAFEAHFGQPAGDSQQEQGTAARPKQKQTQIIDLEKWQAKARSGSSTPKEGQAHQSSLTAPARTSEGQRSMLSSKPASKPALVPTKGKPTAIDPIAFRKKREQEMADKKKRDALAVAQAKERAGLIGNQGSGLSGLGILGKDHSAQPKGTGMMVSSDESSEDDDDDEFDRELFGKDFKSGDTKQKGYTEEQAAALRREKQQGPVKKKRLVRSAKDMRARLAPDLTQLHKKLLSWEYFHEGSFPPNSSPDDYSAVLKAFRDPASYQNTFLPLLILEAWNGFLKAREENTGRPYTSKVLNRSSVDSFLEVSTTMALSDKDTIMEGEIVLLSKARNPKGSSNDPHCLARVIKVTRKKAQLEVLYRTVPGTSLVPFLAPTSELWGLRIMSLIPLEREYGALLGLQYYDLCMEIAEAKPSPLLSYRDETLQPLEQNYGVNKAQAKAIKSALDNDAFTLVQGPPGSGKTKTIVAIVGALLSDTLKGQGTSISRPAPGANVAQSSPLAKKLLVCAPSNAAVDELVMRFKEGVKTLAGEHRRVSVVRIGRSEAINANVQDVTLEELVNKKLNLTAANNGVRQNTQKLMDEHKELSEKLRNTQDLLERAPCKALREEVDALKRKKAFLGREVDNARDNENAQNRQADINRRKAQQEVVDGAHVICATLSGSGHEMFQNLNVEFETVVIDEAAQCVELSALIPLKYGCAKCILVGDPQQLPPTVFSREAARFKYEQSLFVRMQSNSPQHVHLLDTQYRMHPEISAFPSRSFYDGRLLDGKDMAALRSRPWHAAPVLGPFNFFDVQGQHQSAPVGHSLINMAEVNVAISLYKRLITEFRGYDFTNKVGIITPYKSQLRELKDRFRAQFGQSIIDKVEFNTTDAFQGRESEIIIFSCVRASPAGGIGFLQDIRRMNVGLTRAKSSLWVLGNSQSLSRGEYWGMLVQDAKQRGKYISGDLDAKLRVPSRAMGHAENGMHTGPAKDVEMIDSGPASTLARKFDANRPHATSQNSSRSSTPSSPSAASVPAKRKASEELRRESIVSSSSSSSGDMEMTDVAAKRARSTAADSSPSAGSSPASDQSSNGATSTNDQSNNGEAATEAPKPKLHPKVAAILRRRKEVDIFIRKKPRPT